MVVDVEFTNNCKINLYIITVCGSRTGGGKVTPKLAWFVERCNDCKPCWTSGRMQWHLYLSSQKYDLMESSLCKDASTYLVEETVRPRKWIFPNLHHTFWRKVTSPSPADKIWFQIRVWVPNQQLKKGGQTTRLQLQPPVNLFEVVLSRLILWLDLQKVFARNQILKKLMNWCDRLIFPLAHLPALPLFGKALCGQTHLQRLPSWKSCLQNLKHATPRISKAQTIRRRYPYY